VAELSHPRALLAAAADHLADLTTESMAALDAAVAATGAEGPVAELIGVLACSAAEAWLWLAEALEQPPADLFALVLANMAKAERGELAPTGS
jgi:hypothetical protein